MGIHGIPAGEIHQNTDHLADSASTEEELFISADSWAGVHMAPLEWDGAFLYRLVVQDRERAAAGPKADR